ncbi:hypothetical protein ARMGADRAFT_103518 [Armillaria gallica]|uniref:Uncharacterized protein n=1 Tax=Armillaria gallica TaxID=47427 RepID=A0A2H3CUI2_ARMGA|nr:hypothetical protein ARMGADRAFT_103518 [Armillaria gallica]
MILTALSHRSCVGLGEISLHHCATTSIRPTPAVDLGVPIMVHAQEVEEDTERSQHLSSAPHSLLHHSASASSGNFPISTSMHRMSNLLSHLNNVHL